MRFVLSAFLVSYIALSAVMLGLGLLVTQIVVGSRVGSWDDSVVSWLADHRSHAWNRVASVLSTMADTPAVVGIAVAVVVVAAIARWWAELLTLVIGLPLELVVFLTTNLAIGRPRPHVVRLGSLPSTSSFPSGHVAAAIVLYGTVAIVAVRRSRASHGAALLTWLVVGFLGICVGMSRLYEGMHHPTDALAGMLLGVCCLLIAVQITGIWAEARARRTVGETARSSTVTRR